MQAVRIVRHLLEPFLLTTNRRTRSTQVRFRRPPFTQRPFLLRRIHPCLVARQPATGTARPLLGLPEDRPFKVGWQPDRVAGGDYPPAEDGERESVGARKVDFSSKAS